MVMNIAIFEIGSVICATAPSSNALIIGRVISGIGGAGVLPGAFLLVVFLVPNHDRPKYIGALGSVFGITAILGYEAPVPRRKLSIKRNAPSALLSDCLLVHLSNLMAWLT